ncbi:MAG: NHL repeat-containing protein [Verrucomicrobiia bacterium]
MKASFIGFLAVLGLCCGPVQSDADTVYVSTFDLESVLSINSAGTVTTFEGPGSGLNYPDGLALDGSGNLYVANSGAGGTIEVFPPEGGTGSVFATSGLSFPLGLTFDSSGNLYVANAASSTIEEFSPNGSGTVFATAAAGLNGPSALAFDSSGNLYVANEGNYTIEEFGPGGTGTVFATSASGVSNPYGLAWFGGNLYVANGGNNTIERFNALGQGSIFSSTNLLSFPDEIAFDSSGNLYVACNSVTLGDSQILKFNQDGVGSVFASGLDGAVGIAIEEIPEPSALLLLGLGLSALAFSHRRRQ